MKETTKWYLSKTLWLGVIITFQGIVPVVIELLDKGTASPSDVLITLSGIGAVVLRIWFTNTPIEGVK
jgi:hypothetical protein